jgi:hypothetical protein
VHSKHLSFEKVFGNGFLIKFDAASVILNYFNFKDYLIKKCRITWKTEYVHSSNKSYLFFCLYISRLSIDHSSFSMSILSHRTWSTVRI